ncbi:MAG: ATP-binding cassette domain-containing protein [Desulfomicrobium sp.]|jgi:cell division transport system ATP-binding protein|nr:ATP-binding cassette domain-containing protein [Desulfomicrobium sp.]NLV96413.1 ATP-binding cassette domain-containing protein [Desulfovibrionales bacterium]
MISISRLSFSFGKQLALKDINFSMRQGEFVFLCGPSGAGKTTFMRILHGALAVQRGKVDVAGYNMNTLSENRKHFLRRDVSVVYQDFKILPDQNVFANVELPLKVRGVARHIIDKRVRAVLRSLQLDKKAQTLCEELSGGEQQRVAVARAVVVKPKLLLADEPTGNLDRDLAMRMMDIFQQFHKFGTSIMIATHNQEILERMPCARIVTLENGVMHEERLMHGVTP